MGFGGKVEEEDDCRGHKGRKWDHEEEPLQDGAEQVLTEEADASCHHGGEEEKAEVEDERENADQKEQNICKYVPLNSFCHNL